MGEALTWQSWSRTFHSMNFIRAHEHVLSGCYLVSNAFNQPGLVLFNLVTRHRQRECGMGHVKQERQLHRLKLKMHSALAMSQALY